MRKSKRSEVMKTQAVQPNEITIATNKTLTLKMVLISVFSFLLCRADILSSMSPFGVCLTAVIPMKYIWVTLIGSGLGYLSRGLGLNYLIYLAILALVFLGRMLFHKINIGKGLLLQTVNVLLSFWTVYVVSNLFLHFTVGDIGIRICESLIAAGVTCFTYLSVHALLELDSLKKYNSVELASSVILLMLMIISLMGVGVSGLQVGIIIASLGLLITIRQLGVVGGTVGGVVVAIAMNLYSTEYISFSAVLVVSAFIAGLFQEVGRITQVAVFLSVGLFSVFVVGITLDMLFYLMDMMIACGIFFMIPKKYLERLELKKNRITENQSMKDNIGSRLDFAAQTISDLQHSLEKVSDKLNQLDTSDIGIVYHKTTNSVCKGCGLNLFCWDERYGDTVEHFENMTRIIQQKMRLDSKDLDAEPAFDCCHKNLLIDKFNQYYQEYITAENAKRRMTEVRNIAVEQLAGVSQMLWEVKDEILHMKDNDNLSAKVVYDIFSELAVPPLNVFCTQNQYDRMEIDIYTLTGVEFDKEELGKSISHALKLDFAMPSVSIVNNKVRISLYEQANYIVDFGSCQVSSNLEPSEKKTICGDSFEYFLDNQGYAYLILSDGMGCGIHAALDSKMTCSILLKLIKAGFGLDSIIKFVNSSLQIKSSDESLSTIDIVKLDLYTGRAEFYKAGSADSFICLDHHVGEVRTNSLPVGILQGIEFDKQMVKMNADDIIVMMSDGALAKGEALIKNLIHQYGYLDAQKLADKMTEEIVKASKEEVHDDVTVLVIKLQEGV